MIWSLFDKLADWLYARRRVKRLREDIEHPPRNEADATDSLTLHCPRGQTDLVVVYDDEEE